MKGILKQAMLMVLVFLTVLVSYTGTLSAGSAFQEAQDDAIRMRELEERSRRGEDVRLPSQIPAGSATDEERRKFKEEIDSKIPIPKPSIER